LDLDYAAGGQRDDWDGPVDVGRDDGAGPETVRHAALLNRDQGKLAGIVHVDDVDVGRFLDLHGRRVDLPSDLRLPAASGQENSREKTDDALSYIASHSMTSRPIAMFI